MNDTIQYTVDSDGIALLTIDLPGTPRSRPCVCDWTNSGQIDVLIGQGPSARSIRIDLPRFTLVGATTRAGLLTSPLRDRFGWSARLDYYPDDALRLIIERSARLLDLCCGAGRHMIPLVEMGFEVTGLDRRFLIARFRILRHGWSRNHR